MAEKIWKIFRKFKKKLFSKKTNFPKHQLPFLKLFFSLGLKTRIKIVGPIRNQLKNDPNYANYEVRSGLTTTAKITSFAISFYSRKNLHTNICIWKELHHSLWNYLDLIGEWSREKNIFTHFAIQRPGQNYFQRIITWEAFASQTIYYP